MKVAWNQGARWLRPRLPPMVDFFHRQEVARLNTVRLLPYFLLAISLTSVALYVVCIGAYAIVIPMIDTWRSIEIAVSGGDHDIRMLSRFWIPGLLYAVVGLSVSSVFAGSMYKFYRLRKGGRVIAIALGGRLIDPATENSDERRLLNVVEEMSIASSTPMPDVYVLERDNSLNAFAAGYSVHDMVIGVTEGCLRVLTRDEIQGVIAHEFSHILNGDMRLNMRLTGIVHGLYCLTLVAYALMTEAEGREVEDKSLLEIIVDLARGGLGFVLAFIGFNGALFGRVIKSAVCRQREFLADAAAVQFTRYPDGLAGALKKAESWANRRSLTPAAEEVSHIFFNNVRDDNQSSLTSTHPSIAERIQRLDPGFNRSIVRPDFSLSGGETADHRESARRREATHANHVDRFVSAIPAPTDEHLTYATQLLASLPGPVVRASRKPAGACALVYALLANREPDTHDRQLKRLGVVAEELEAVRTLLPVVAAMDIRTALPLVEIAVPALRRLGSTERGFFLRTIHTLVHSDNQLDIFEFALQKMLRRHLELSAGLAQEKVRFLRIRPLAESCSVLLSALAHVGHDAPDKMADAFHKGGMTLGLPVDEVRLLSLPECDLARLETALSEISEAAPGIRNLILNACMQTVSSDGFIGIKETELVRAIADTVGCAIPPALSTALRLDQARAAQQCTEGAA